MSDAYRCVLLFGPPGAGKGTQGARLGKLDNCVHLATGDMFRGLDAGSELGQKVASFSSKGELVPDAITVQLWQSHVAGMIARGEYSPKADVLLLDGIPRTEAQAAIMETLIAPAAILHLVVSDLDTMVARMKHRAETQGRADDADEDIVRNRFTVYDRETAPVLGHYDRALVQDIDAQQSIDEVYSATSAVIAGVLAG
ncbi:MAG: adenylate kinase [Pseudohongiellaceae bacterium]|jgi:adenylate kinase